MIEKGIELSASRRPSRGAGLGKGNARGIATFLPI